MANNRGHFLRPMIMRTCKSEIYCSICSSNFFSLTPVEEEATLFFPAGVVKPPGEGEDKSSSGEVDSIWVGFLVMKYGEVQINACIKI